MRYLSPSFVNDLINENGLLHSLLEHIKRDNTLLLAIRKERINVYYRGGNLLRVSRKKNGTYSLFFDDNYNELGVPMPDLPTTIEKHEGAHAWIETFPYLRAIMDTYFSNHNKPEREFQQLIARENNFSSISNQTEYFITDVEFADSSISARFDMLAVRWAAADRKDGRKCRVALIEMKYGDNALSGNAGILKHLEDFNKFILDIKRKRDESFLEIITSQFNQIDQLGLFKFKHATRTTEVKLNIENKPEVIFVFANHNPRSTKLLEILNDPRVKELAEAGEFDLKFFVSSFVGYAFHTHCMYPLADFRQLLQKQSELGRRGRAID